MTIQADVRDPLATALSSVAANVYDHVPEAVIPPFCAITYGAPMMEPNIINQATVKVKLNFLIQAGVAYNSNPGALDNLEQLVISILGALPSGYVVESVDTPAIVSVGASNLLSASVIVSTYYTETE
jgi:hypothetical protein